MYQTMMRPIGDPIPHGPPMGLPGLPYDPPYRPEPWGPHKPWGPDFPPHKPWGPDVIGPCGPSVPEKRWPPIGLPHTTIPYGGASPCTPSRPKRRVANPDCSKCRGRGCPECEQVEEEAPTANSYASGFAFMKKAPFFGPTTTMMGY